MATDRARRSFDPTRMYRSVVSQQGRVTLEADANEADEIRAAEARAALVDVIGPSGSPDDGYRVTVPPTLGDYDFAIGAGVIYVGGVRIESSGTTYARQRTGDWADYDLRAIAATDRGAAPVDPEPYPKAPGRELIYLEVIEQEVTAVEDPALREVAIGGPDTAARTRMLRRVHRRPVTAGSCEDAFAEVLPSLTGSPGAAPRPFRPPERRPLPMAFEIGRDIAAGRVPPLGVGVGVGALGGALGGVLGGALAPTPAPTAPAQQLIPATRLKVDFVPGENTGDPCQPAAQSGFLGVENQLIRVQIAAGGKALLWSYDNASFLYRAKVDAHSPRKLALAAPPVDAFHNPRTNQWVELLVTSVVLDGSARIASPVGRPVQVAAYDPTDQTLTLQEDTTGLPGELFVRVWENRQAIVAGPIALVGADNLATGVRVTITGDAFPGDHWMIGVRPGVPDAIYPARLRSEQPPDGPRRWVVSLAVVDWTDAHTATVSDCRKPFRPLTEDDDLAFHNQHLHGWGVVCGLQVQCPPLDGTGLVRPEEMVIVRDGYAIHPSGNDIRVDTVAGETPVALGDLGVAEHVLKRENGKIADGAVSLWIDERRRFHVERYDPAHKRTWPERLEGTMLWDVISDCVLPLWTFARSQLVPAAGEGPVGPAARRRIALTNLYWQLALASSPTWSGKRIYLSGSPGPQAETEDKLLRELFLALKSHLEPRTFCAMFDDVAYPDYDVYRAAAVNDPHPTTIFGTGRHTRLRLDEARQLAFTCGGDDRVNVYDLKSFQFVASVAFPIAGAEVKDVAFSLDGNDLYAIAATTATASAFAQGAIGADNVLRWSAAQPHALPDLQLATLAVDRKGELYAAAIGKGIYHLVPGPNPKHERWFDSFFATGHLAAGRFGDSTFLYAGEAKSPGATDFSRVLGLEVSSGQRRFFPLPAVGGKPGVGRDDLVTMRGTGANIDDPYAIMDGAPGERLLVRWTPTGDDSLKEPGAQPKQVSLGASAGSRVACSPSGRTGLVTYLDGSVGKPYVPGSDRLRDESHPLQVGPVAVAATGLSFYVLNLVSSTITAIPATANSGSAIDVGKLETYRAAAIAAYMKLFGRLVQFLKDCVCQHLLVECPTGAGRVYLADISFQNGKVYQICNFGRRKYVHSFPTVEYWLSLVPIIPLIKEQIEAACCAVITGWFDALAEPPTTKTPDTIARAGARGGLGWLLSADVAAAYKARKSQLQVGRDVVRAAALEKLRPAIPAPSPARVLDHGPGDPAPDNAHTSVENRGLVVRGTQVVTPGIALELLTSPPTVRGDTVDLITDASGRVLGWRRVAPEAARIAAPAELAAPAPPAEEVTALRRQLEEMHQKLGRLEAALADPGRPHG